MAGEAAGGEVRQREPLAVRRWWQDTRVDRGERDASDAFGPLADLSDVESTAAAIGQVLSMLLADYEPLEEYDSRLVYHLGAALQGGETGEPDLDAALREAWINAPDRPLSEWHVEVTFDEIVRVAHVLTTSRTRPDTQLLDERSLEVLVREDTPNPRLRNLRQSRDVSYNWQSGNVQFEARLGRPSVALLLRCALRRSGIARLHVFEGERINEFLLAAEARQGLRPGDHARTHAWRVLREAAEPTVVSLRVTAGQALGARQIEDAMTAFRARLAYESDLVLGLVQDVDHLHYQHVQPPLMRQLYVGAPAAVEAIAAWGADGGTAPPPRTGLPGEILYGPVSLVDEELALRYLRALAAHDAFSAFMGYYHIVEYFMEDAWYRELSGRVPELTPPGQMPTDAAALRTFTRTAAGRLGVNPQEIRLTERNALKALMRTTIDLQRVATDLERYFSGALRHFSVSPVPFADADVVNLRTTDSDLPDRVAERIYRVRNAIAHSKASTTRYSPYTDDLHLAREVPLVRLAAEQLMVPDPDRI
ncbi:hypothetical protein DKT68_06830 [Micromonospora acroterricola]|uniref:Uncharacterized protein n=1 Tax=Micromonospora acroterricola TaxID=2202421 RepID=A0A317D8D4_9ACTN|nr:hypothetical protein [Micromonospora acroterricola]PWR11151.1 hypothetical protein DKT68_06830 [Micromonospora acroterricola]